MQLAWSFPSIVKHFLHVCSYIVEIVWTGAILLLYSYLRCGYKSSSSIPVTQRLRMSKLPSDNCCLVLAMIIGIIFIILHLHGNKYSDDFISYLTFIVFAGLWNAFVWTPAVDNIHCYEGSSDPISTISSPISPDHWPPPEILNFCNDIFGKPWNIL